MPRCGYCLELLRACIDNEWWVHRDTRGLCSADDWCFYELGINIERARGQLFLRPGEADRAWLCMKPATK